MSLNQQYKSVPENENSTIYLSYEHTFKLKHDSFIAKTILPKILEMRYHRQAKLKGYLIHNWIVTIQSNEVKVTFEYTRLDGELFNERMVLFKSFLQTEFHSYEINSLFEVLNKIDPPAADELIFKGYQYLENHPDKTILPFKYTNFQLNSIGCIGSESELLDDNAQYYQMALTKVKHYLERFSQSSSYCLDMYISEKEDVRYYYVRIISYFDAIDFDKLEKDEYVKSVLLVPSLEIEYMHSKENE